MPASPFWHMVLFVGIGVFQACIAIPLIQRQVKRNYIYGVRLPKTLSSDSIWYDANEYGGRQLFGSGLLSAVLVFIAYCVPPLHNNFTAFSLACMVLFVVPLAIGLSRTFRYIDKL